MLRNHGKLGVVLNDDTEKYVSRSLTELDVLKLEVFQCALQFASLK